jgi:hypothetical protein
VIAQGVSCVKDGGENDSITNRKSTRNGKKLETKEVVKEFMEAST